MSISTTIPESWRLPLFWAVVDGSKAGNLSEASRALLVGQMFTSGANAGTALPDVPIPIGSVALAGQMFGVGSMLYQMVVAFFNCNTTQQLWGLPVAEGVGTASAGSVEVTAGEGSGLLSLYIAGQLVEVAVASTDTSPTIAANLASAINAIPSLPVTATVLTNAVTLTAQWKGSTGDGISIVANFLGHYGGEVFPDGLSLEITPMDGGTGEPNFVAAISAIQALEFDYVGMPYSDTGSLTTWATEYGFGQTGRWSYTRQQYGMILNARADTYAGLLTWGLTKNAPVISTMAIELDSPSPIWEWTAAYCSLAALGFSDDPARPLQTLEMPGIKSARLQYRFTQMMINSLTNSGLAIQSMAPSGQPMIMREQTQYQLNSFGQSDTAFGLLTVIATLQELLRRMKSAITSKYPRVKLVPDGTKIGPGQAAVTPKDIKGELVAEYVSAEYDGLVADTPNFKKFLQVEIDDQNPNTLKVLWPPRLAGQLRQFDALAQFRLQYPPVAVN